MIIIGSQNNSGWEGPQETCSQTCCLKQSQLCGQIRLLTLLKYLHENNLDRLNYFFLNFLEMLDLLQKEQYSTRFHGNL